MRGGDLVVEGADRHRRETQRGHGREPRRLHDAAKGDPDRLLQLVKRGDRLVIGWASKMHDDLPLDGLARLLPARPLAPFGARPESVRQARRRIWRPRSNES
jgi:hypothetical protein